MNKTINQYYIAKTLRMANYLAKKFNIIKVQTDKFNPNYKIFVFQDSLELRNYLEGYKCQKMS
ncbi:hypothetical protein NE172_04845 [Clostridium botulinum]|uniref:Uncharacterized protein n=1 Tax=Clostridium botulinum TaxID=1491 RepID=A0A6B4JJW6_CLOBO|nr:hypothetical protein [Clostridium botulinum]EES50027.1 hypothetical protein CLO_1340 [Clostridium botulinum E1 str. 'BoNT E Beluga']MBY6760488.1 hypothetical protein [Clostridium botulinum]MBY6919395.1 hypothetical protein [Clostridium botulinum]MCR1130273.1 hypothetical protein [Clostridium botulinum]NFJ56965.1 hypothetical protein [Clostridium botulinum]